MSKIELEELAKIERIGQYGMEEIPELKGCKNKGPFCMSCGNTDLFHVTEVDLFLTRDGMTEKQETVYPEVVCNECDKSDIYFMYDDGKAVTYDQVALAMNDDNEERLVSQEELYKSSLINLGMSDFQATGVDPEDWDDLEDEDGLMIVAKRSEGDIDFTEFDIDELDEEWEHFSLLEE